MTHIRRYIRIPIFLLAVAMLLTAVACGKSPDAADGASESTSTVDTTAPAETTTLAEEPFALLDDDAQARFAIVRPSNASDAIIQAGITLHQALNQLTGAQFRLSEDFLLPNVTEETLATSYEILLGATNRAESTRAGEGLAANEYVIRADGNKIVLIGGSDSATYEAVQVFVAMLGAEDFLLTRELHVRETYESQGYLVALTNQAQSLLEVHDLSRGQLDNSSRVWSYQMPYSNIAGAKLRHSETYGDVALAVCGSSYGCMISYPEGKLLWSTERAANNPHSIELMPNGVIAIASSTGNEVRFFTMEDAGTKNPAAFVIRADAHGVLWDEQNQVLWAVGRAVLTAYRVTLNADHTVTVTEDTSRRYTIPTDHAHDLAPVYGDTNALWISTGSKVYRFDKTTGKFATDYPGSEYLNRGSVKGVGNFADGSLIYIYPDGVQKSWTSRSMVFVRNQDGSMVKEELVSETGHFYKVRVWCADYQ